MKTRYQFRVPEEKRIRYIICSDAKNEADDQFAIVHSLMTEKFDLRGIVAGHFNICGNRYPAGETAKASYAEIMKLLELMDISCPVYTGAGLLMPDAQTPICSPGAEFIIEEAMREDSRPLYIGLQGSLTDLASAILLKPEICGRMTGIWVGGAAYPDGGDEFNLLQDIPAAQVVFRSSMPLWQIPKPAYSQFVITLAELQWKVASCGEIGRYLFEQLLEVNQREARHPSWPNGESWVMGDMAIAAVLLDHMERTDLYTERPAPEIAPDMRYLPSGTNRMIRVYHTLSVRMAFEDFFAKLALNFPS